ncbi:putative periphilin-1-like [Scophthalmus maximus]|uniref:Putative periphilin-1-like n=1 Tax=Scophthalmus maximus TaxID=52904 RepID=A0A2U9B2K2_SCOMX|nr:putative periphilin-1-like [Scophthalmus maximus]
MKGVVGPMNIVLKISHTTQKSSVTYRRDRSIREVYDERFVNERPGPYPRAGGAVERRGPFGRPEDDYNRGGYDYEGGPRFFPNGGGPRSYHEDQRGYHGDNVHFPAERRAVPPSRREDFPYRGPREDPHAGRPLEFGEDRDHYRRKSAPFPPLRERSPVRREVARSPHSRSGSSVSSRGYSPDRAKSLPFPSQQGKRYEDTYSQSKMTVSFSLHISLSLAQVSPCQNLFLYLLSPDKIPGLSREGSPHSATSNKEENHPPEVEKEEPLVAPVVEESQSSAENFQEQRALAIAAKAQEIEKVYRQDCETFGIVVKMLVAKDPNLEKQLQVPLRENLGEIRERCLEDLKHFIHELDEAVRQPEPAVCDSTTPSTSLVGHKLTKTAVNHSSSY